MREATYPAGTVIFRRGDAGDALYLVERGRVAVVADDVGQALPSASEWGRAPALLQHRVLARLGPGDAFGEIALVTGEPRTATIVVEQDAALLSISRDDFDHAMTRLLALREAVHTLSMRRLLSTMAVASPDDAARWHEMAVSGVRHVSQSERSPYLKQAGHGGGVPVAIFMGSLLDGIPECIVIGAAFVSLATFNPTFLVAVFVADFAEAMSSAAGMKLAGFSSKKILGMWGGAVVASAVAGALGNAFLVAAPAAAITFVEAVAGGAILGMLAATMMPVAFEEGGESIGLATIAGFLTTFLITAVKIA